MVNYYLCIVNVCLGAKHGIICHLGQSYELFLKPPNISKKKEIKWRKLYCANVSLPLLRHRGRGRPRTPLPTSPRSNKKRGAPEVDAPPFKPPPSLPLRGGDTNDSAETRDVNFCHIPSPFFGGGGSWCSSDYFFCAPAALNSWLPFTITMLPFFRYLPSFLPSSA